MASAVIAEFSFVLCLPEAYNLRVFRANTTYPRESP